MNIKITGIVDNYSESSKFRSDWGFSTLIKTDYHNILFDAGSDPEVFEHNINLIDPDLKKIDILFISHSHKNHIGAIKYVLKNYRVGNIVIPEEQNEEIENKLREIKVRPIIINKPTSIDEGIYSTGILGEEREQSLVIPSEKGLILITGCAHSGIKNISEHVEKTFSDKIYMIIGGLHLYKKYDQVLKEDINEINKLQFKYILPSHCTGDTAKKLLKQKLNDRFMDFGAGVTINL
jgi:7,8-dihydropterin-6-yl-methyl-4-(beta-D-ribofuranosyl)aminobenzene 5'-phosphate synthase